MATAEYFEKPCLCNYPTDVNECAESAPACPLGHLQLTEENGWFNCVKGFYSENMPLLKTVYIE